MKEYKSDVMFYETRVPAKGRVLAIKIEDVKKTAGGIILTDTDDSPLRKTKILAVGDCNNKFTVGHAAYIQRHNGIDIGNDELMLVENEILFTEPL